MVSVTALETRDSSPTVRTQNPSEKSPQLSRNSVLNSWICSAAIIGSEGGGLREGLCSEECMIQQHGLGRKVNRSVQHSKHIPGQD
jgi:hypothetical protein